MIKLHTCKARKIFKKGKKIFCFKKKNKIKIKKNLAQVSLRQVPGNTLD